MDAAHTIFHEPFRVDLAYEDLPTPENYRRYPEGRDLPETLKAWRVHHQPDPRNYGLVSDGYGFEDSPDCEAISGGENSKGPNSLALGRQANWFLWGFCAAPADMTESARLVFLNTIAYMKQFDGDRPLVTKERSAREWAFVYAGLLENEEIRSYVRRKFDSSLLEAAGDDGERLTELVQEDFEYLREEGAFQVDADAKALGIPNRDPALLETCVSLLEAGEDTERAQRLLERYTDQTFEDAAGWRAWLDAHRDRLFFSDVGGYRYFAGPE